MSDTPSLFPELPFSFGPRFLRDHAGHIITDPHIALVELVANSYDAGASQVNIQWPEAIGGEFKIIDNGTGMSAEQFNRRWKTLSYSRPQEQGLYVEYPPGVKGKKREAFGQNGKGRYGAFCFADSYTVETWQNGKVILIKVTITEGGIEPFHCELVSSETRDGHGTCLGGTLKQSPISPSDVALTIGSKFLVDPFLRIAVNGTRLNLLSLSGVSSASVQVDDHGKVEIHQIDASTQDRTTLLRGMTWWVNGRMVGNPSWDGLDERGAILDGRTGLAKRCSFVIEADFLREDVKGDWTGFHDTPRSIATRNTVRTYVISALDKVLSEVRREKKKEALTETRQVLGKLPSISKRIIGAFVDEVQQKCPTLSHGDLVRTVSIFAKMEVARSGYELLDKLESCSPDDLDTWNRLMEEWTASGAEVVLSELKRRLGLIERLQALVNVKTTDELHELQPLFAQGLWIFGPEYESVEFTSNRAMSSVIRVHFGGDTGEDSTRRPDLVALPDSSIGVYSADSFDNDGEVAGIRKILIVELKKGGYTIGTAELRQGEDYALGIQTAHLAAKEAEIVVYVLGAGVNTEAADERVVGKNIRIVPMIYGSLLKRAHARTFNLQKKLEAVQPSLRGDAEVEAVLGMESLIGQ